MFVVTTRSRTLPVCRLSETPQPCPSSRVIQRWGVSRHAASMWLRLVAAVVVCSLVATSRAEVFERDWKEPGDGLLTYDNVNHREWLDLSETLLEQFAEPGAVFPEGHYANVVAELGPGGLFEGFIVGKRQDLIALAESAGIDSTTTDFETNSRPLSELMELIDVTRSNQLGRMRSQGFLDEFSQSQIPRCPCREAGVFQFSPPLTPNGTAHAALLFAGSDDLFEASTMGVMLYRAAIPEPRSIALGLTCISVAMAAACCKALPNS
jgi:hypothetical protein